MNWITVLVIAAIVVVIFIMKRAGQISPKDAQSYLKKGALVIDVRSPSEFDSDHLPTALNIPLDEIETALPRCLKDKNQVLLVHCQSGVRSGMAKQRLKAWVTQTSSISAHSVAPGESRATLAATDSAVMAKRCEPAKNEKNRKRGSFLIFSTR
jgi:phage shock protein E